MKTIKNFGVDYKERVEKAISCLQAGKVFCWSMTRTGKTKEILFIPQKDDSKRHGFDDP